MAAALEIHVIADSSGETAARLARAARMQFPSREFQIVRHARVHNAEQMLEVFDAISTSADPERGQAGRAVFYTLVNGELRGMVARFCTDKAIPCADLMGDALDALAAAAGTDADEVPMRPVGVEADYFDRISAMEFAVRNDDGVMPDSLRECDICLVGASRSGGPSTSGSPLTRSSPRGGRPRDPGGSGDRRRGGSVVLVLPGVRVVGGVVLVRPGRAHGGDAVVLVQVGLLVGVEVAVGVDGRGVLDGGLGVGHLDLAVVHLGPEQRHEVLLRPEQAGLDGHPGGPAGPVVQVDLPDAADPPPIAVDDVRVVQVVVVVVRHELPFRRGGLRQ